MYFIDTNIHIAFLLQNLENDELTKKYLQEYNLITLKNRVISDCVLGELETFMLQVMPSRYRLSLEEKQKIKSLTLEYIDLITQKCSIVGTSGEEVRRARGIFFEMVGNYYLSFFDCLILATAEAHNYTILSKDQKLIAKAQELHLSVLEP